MPEDTYVVDRASERGIAIVLATTFELVRIASGHPMVLGTMDGQEVCVKLATPEEFLEVQARARERLHEQGVVDRDAGPPPSTYAEATRLVQPLDIA